MEPVTHLRPLTDAITRVRQQARSFESNFFFNWELAETWIDRGSLFYKEGSDGLLIFRRNQAFYHVYHVAVDTRALSGQLASLAQISQLRYRPLVSDLVGVPENIYLVADVYREQGFREYSSLFRMVKLSGRAIADRSTDPDVVFATEADVQSIGEFLEQQLDPLVDQIPDSDDLVKAVGRDNVLIVRRDGLPAGLLIFEKTGLTTILRYWYVSPQFRGYGIGARLIRTFFRLCCGGKRILLWVATRNSDSIAKYRHYGFRQEHIEDQIMVRES